MQERITNGKIKGFITRAYSHTGPRRGKNFSISSDAYQIAKIIKSGKKSGVIGVGNLTTTRIVIDVRDVVMAYYLLMKNGCDGVFNVCGYEPKLMSFFTDKLIEISGLDIQKEINPNFYRPIDIGFQQGSSGELIHSTGWCLEYDIDTTLKDLLNYWINKL
jgi:nucleoside-diphosphate-sugar epimerase